MTDKKFLMIEVSYDQFRLFPMEDGLSFLKTMARGIPVTERLQRVPFSDRRRFTTIILDETDIDQTLIDQLLGPAEPLPEESNQKGQTT